MEQGRLAVCHALGLPEGHSADIIPVGECTIPKMASVGLDETAARKRYREVLIGQAKFHEIACGQISDIRNGLLNKMVADPTGEGVLGV
jgi:NAD(P) transhydrogenase